MCINDDRIERIKKCENKRKLETELEEFNGRKKKQWLHLVACLFSNVSESDKKGRH